MEGRDLPCLPGSTITITILRPKSAQSDKARHSQTDSRPAVVACGQCMRSVPPSTPFAVPTPISTPPSSSPAPSCPSPGHGLSYLSVDANTATSTSGSRSSGGGISSLVCRTGLRARGSRMWSEEGGVSLELHSVLIGCSAFCLLVRPQPLAAARHLPDCLSPVNPTVSMFTC